MAKSVPSVAFLQIVSTKNRPNQKHGLNCMSQVVKWWDLLIASSIMAVEAGAAFTELPCLEAFTVSLQAVRLLTPAALLPACHTHTFSHKDTFKDATWLLEGTSYSGT